LKDTYLRWKKKKLNQVATEQTELLLKGVGLYTLRRGGVKDHGKVLAMGTLDSKGPRRKYHGKTRGLHESPKSWGLLDRRGKLFSTLYRGGNEVGG